MRHMLRLLDEEPWLTMFLIADQCEERGDPHLAAGWRWLARRKKHPERVSFWEWGDYARQQRSGELPGFGTWQLPNAAISCLRAAKPRMGRRPLEFDSCSEACQRAAEAMATLSRQGIDISNLERVSE